MKTNSALCYAFRALTVHVHNSRFIYQVEGGVAKEDPAAAAARAAAEGINQSNEAEEAEAEAADKAAAEAAEDSDEKPGTAFGQVIPENFATRALADLSNLINGSEKPKKQNEKIDTPESIVKEIYDLYVQEGKMTPETYTQHLEKTQNKVSTTTGSKEYFTALLADVKTKDSAFQEKFNNELLPKVNAILISLAQKAVAPTPSPEAPESVAQPTTEDELKSAAAEADAGLVEDHAAGVAETVVAQNDDELVSPASAVDVPVPTHTEGQVEAAPATPDEIEKLHYPENLSTGVALAEEIAAIFTYEKYGTTRFVQDANSDSLETIASRQTHFSALRDFLSKGNDYSPALQEKLKAKLPRINAYLAALEAINPTGKTAPQQSAPSAAAVASAAGEVAPSEKELTSAAAATGEAAAETEPALDVETRRNIITNIFSFYKDNGLMSKQDFDANLATFLEKANNLTDYNAYVKAIFSYIDEQPTEIKGNFYKKINGVLKRDDTRYSRNAPHEGVAAPAVAPGEGELVSPGAAGEGVAEPTVATGEDELASPPAAANAPEMPKAEFEKAKNEVITALDKIKEACATLPTVTKTLDAALKDIPQTTNADALISLLQSTFGQIAENGYNPIEKVGSSDLDNEESLTPFQRDILHGHFTSYARILDYGDLGVSATSDAEKMNSITTDFLPRVLRVTIFALKYKTGDEASRDFDDPSMRMNPEGSPLRTAEAVPVVAPGEGELVSPPAVVEVDAENPEAKVLTGSALVKEIFDFYLANGKMDPETYDANLSAYQTAMLTADKGRGYLYNLVNGLRNESSDFNKKFNEILWPKILPYLNSLNASPAAAGEKPNEQAKEKFTEQIRKGLTKLIEALNGMVTLSNNPHMQAPFDKLVQDLVTIKDPNQLIRTVEADLQIIKNSLADTDPLSAEIKVTIDYALRVLKGNDADNIMTGLRNAGIDITTPDKPKEKPKRAPADPRKIVENFIKKQTDVTEPEIAEALGIDVIRLPDGSIDMTKVGEGTRTLQKTIRDFDASTIPNRWLREEFQKLQKSPGLRDGGLGRMTWRAHQIMTGKATEPTTEYTHSGEASNYRYRYNLLNDIHMYLHPGKALDNEPGDDKGKDASGEYTFKTDGGKDRDTTYYAGRHSPAEKLPQEIILGADGKPTKEIRETPTQKLVDDVDAYKKHILDTVLPAVRALDNDQDRARFRDQFTGRLSAMLGISESEIKEKISAPDSLVTFTPELVDNSKGTEEREYIGPKGKKGKDTFSIPADPDPNEITDKAQDKIRGKFILKKIVADMQEANLDTSVMPRSIWPSDTYEAVVKEIKEEILPAADKLPDDQKKKFNAEFLPRLQAYINEKK